MISLKYAFEGFLAAKRAENRSLETIKFYQTYVTSDVNSILWAGIWKTLTPGHDPLSA